VSTPIRLTRTEAHLDVHDVDQVRAWLMDAVRTEIKLKGTPHPRLVLVGQGFVDTLDLDAMTRTDPQADAGHTFQAMRQRADIHRALVVMVGEGRLAESEGTRNLGIVFEERVVDGARRWWMAMLPYDKDPGSGLGVPDEAWHQSHADPGGHGETSNPAALPGFLQALVAPPPGGRAATVLEPGQPITDVGVRYGELDEREELPDSPLALVELASRMVVPGLLSGDLRGAIVVRFAGRSWEAWQLPGQGVLPTEDLVRYVANVRQPPADAVALVQVAIRPEDEPPAPGVQVIAEKGGDMAETWSPLAFPEGPGKPEIQEVLLRGPNPVPESGLWLGCEPRSDLELIHPMMGEA